VRNYNWQLRKAITEKYRTQEDFCDALGLQPAKMSRIPQGRCNPDEGLKKRITEALGITESMVSPSTNPNTLPVNVSA
jgi:transcriptional regulator with XRE-family HTH domain